MIAFWDRYESAYCPQQGATHAQEETKRAGVEAEAMQEGGQNPEKERRGESFVCPVSCKPTLSIGSGLCYNDFYGTEQAGEVQWKFP